MNRRENRQRFFKGLLFVGTAYCMVKLIDQYPLLFEQLAQLQSALMPFIIAFIFAYLFNPLLNVLQRKTSWSRGVQLTVIYLSFLVVCGIGTRIVAPMIYQNASDLIKQIPDFATKIQDGINQWSDQFSGTGWNETMDLKAQLLSAIPKLTELLTTSLSSLVTWMYSAVLGTGNLLFGFILSIYLLLEKEVFLESGRRLLKITLRQHADHTLSAGRLVHENIGKYLVGKTVDSIFVGVCATLGLMAMGGQYAVLFGLIFGVTNMIPFIGPIIGMCFISGVHLFYHPMLAIAILVYLFIIQQIETLVVDPKVVGQKVGLNPILTLLAVSLGGKFMGVVGMVLGVPLMGVIKQYAGTYINQTYERLYPEPIAVSEE